MKVVARIRKHLGKWQIQIRKVNYPNIITIFGENPLKNNLFFDRKLMSMIIFYLFVNFF